MGRYVGSPLIVALSPGHIDITRFLPWSLTAIGNHLDHTEPKNSGSCSDDVFHPLSGISGLTARRDSVCLNLQA